MCWQDFVYLYLLPISNMFKCKFWVENWHWVKSKFQYLKTAQAFIDYLIPLALSFLSKYDSSFMKSSSTLIFYILNCLIDTILVWKNYPLIWTWKQNLDTSYINMPFNYFSSSLVIIFLYGLPYYNIKINMSVKYGSQSSETSCDSLVESRILLNEEIKKTKYAL